MNTLCLNTTENPQILNSIKLLITLSSINIFILRRYLSGFDINDSIDHKLIGKCAITSRI